MHTYLSNEMIRYNHLLGEIDHVYHEMSLKLGLSDSAMIILYTICNYGESCPLQDICRLSGLSKQTINSAIRKLEAEGTVYLTSAGAKNKTVCLTEAGKLLAEKTALRIIQIENAVFASWPREDTCQYLALTEKFLAEITEKAKELNIIEHE